MAQEIPQVIALFLIYGLILGVIMRLSFSFSFRRAARRIKDWAEGRITDEEVIQRFRQTEGNPFISGRERVTIQDGKDGACLRVGYGNPLVIIFFIVDLLLIGVAVALLAAGQWLYSALTLAVLIPSAIYVYLYLVGPLLNPNVRITSRFERRQVNHEHLLLHILSTPF
jgi:hypothetical protein